MGIMAKAETRPANRKVSYVSEILETIPPTSDQIYQDAGQPIGYFVNGESVHIGYKARLWKVVTVDGKEVSREQIGIKLNHGKQCSEA